MDDEIAIEVTYTLGDHVKKIMINNAQHEEFLNKIKEHSLEQLLFQVYHGMIKIRIMKQYLFLAHGIDVPELPPTPEKQKVH